MTTVGIDSMGRLAGMQRELVARLELLRRRVRWALVIEGLAEFVAEFVGVVLVMFVLDYLLRLGLTARVGLDVAAVVFLGIECWRRLVRPMRMRVGLVALAGAMDRAIQSRDRKGATVRQGEDEARRSLTVAALNDCELAGRVASVLELPGLLGTKNPPSEAMVEQAVAKCHAALAGVNFEAAIDWGRRRKAMGVIVAALIVLPVLQGIFPGQANLWMRRMFLASNEAWPQNTYLEVADVKDGRITVPRGEAYVLRVKGREGSGKGGGVPERVHLTIRSIGVGGKTTELMKEFAKNDFRHEFAVIDLPLQLELEGGDDVCGPIAVTPVDRPRIAGLELISRHPRDKADEVHHFTGNEGDLSFLTQTRLVLAVTSNVPLRELRVKGVGGEGQGNRIGNSEPRPSGSDRAITPPQSQSLPDGRGSDRHLQSPWADRVRRVDATHYVIEWTHEAAARFEMELVAAESGLVSLPVPVRVGLKVDQVPRVTLAYSGVRQRITPMAKVPLVVEGRDDYGMIAAGLAIKNETPDPADAAKLVAQESRRELWGGATQASGQPSATQPMAMEAELHLKETLDVGAMKLTAGSLVTLTAEATDDCYTGRQTGRSRSVTFRLVPPEELFREILQRQQAERVKFRKQIEEAEKIRDGIRAVADSRGAAELARRHRAFQRETLRIGTTLTESLTEIKLNALGSPESHAMMELNVLTPLKGMQEELVSPQGPALDTLVSARGEGGGGVDPANVQAAADREDRIVIRMKSLLKQMAQWDSFVDVLNQLDAIIRLETQVKDQSEKLKKKEDESIFDR